MTQKSAPPSVSAIASSLAFYRPPGFSLYQEGGRVLLSRHWNSVEPRVETLSFLDEEICFALAGVWDGTNLSVFVDGVRASRDSFTESSGTRTAPQSLIVGAERTGNGASTMGFHFEGAIDEIRVSQVARYSEDYVPKRRLESDSDTLALYHCDEGAGLDLEDSSPQGNHARLNQAGWVESPAWGRKPFAVRVEEPRIALPQRAPASWPEDAPPSADVPFDEATAKTRQEAWADYLGVPMQFENSIGMTFRLVPPGAFDRGSTVEETERVMSQDPRGEAYRACVRSEAPRHRTILTRPFYVGAFEVTQEQFERVEKKNPSIFAPRGSAKGLVVGLDTAKLPADSISWSDAAEFCGSLSELEGLRPSHARSDRAGVELAGTGYRLPTDAEWEYACRAGSDETYWFGEEVGALSSAAWTGSNSDGRTHTVGELRANPFGLHDVLGNVWEWTADAWTEDAYAQFDGKTSVDPLGPKIDGWFRCFRGGGFGNADTDCRSAHRYGAPLPHRHPTFGFRVALDVEAAKNVIRRVNEKDGSP